MMQYEDRGNQRRGGCKCWNGNAKDRTAASDPCHSHRFHGCCVGRERDDGTTLFASRQVVQNAAALIGRQQALCKRVQKVRLRVRAGCLGRECVAQRIGIQWLQYEFRLSLERSDPFFLPKSCAHIRIQIANVKFGEEFITACRTESRMEHSLTYSFANACCEPVELTADG